jgi:hypothetical protein
MTWLTLASVFLCGLAVGIACANLYVTANLRHLVAALQMLINAQAALLDRETREH